jgi:hypothetical protein
VPTSTDRSAPASTSGGSMMPGTGTTDTAIFAQIHLIVMIYVIAGMIQGSARTWASDSSSPSNAVTITV